MISATSIFTAFIKTMASVTPLHLQVLDNTVLKNVLLFCVFVAHRLNLWRFENENAGSENDWKASGDKFSFYFFSQKKFFCCQRNSTMHPTNLFSELKFGFPSLFGVAPTFSVFKFVPNNLFFFLIRTVGQKKARSKKNGGFFMKRGFCFLPRFSWASRKKQSSGKTTTKTKTKPLMNRCCRCRVSFVSCRIVSYRLFEGEPLITSELSISHSASLELNRCWANYSFLRRPEIDRDELISTRPFSTKRPRSTFQQPNHQLSFSLTFRFNR